MKLAIVYDPEDNKLRLDTYSYIYAGMFEALCGAFEEVDHITRDRNAQDIDADLIFFFDPQSCHDIEIFGVDKHPAVKMEYMSDPHQAEVRGIHKQYGTYVHKLGPENRIERARFRGVTHIVSPVRDGFLRHLGKYAHDMHLLHFPPAPSFGIKGVPFSERKNNVLANGCTWSGELKCYEFRKWAFKQNYVKVVPHYLQNPDTPHGEDYSELLYLYAGGLALSEYYPVPKYFEMPACGMVTFVQYHPEYEDLGFKDYVNCIYVTQDNFEYRVKSFLADAEGFEHIGKEGQKLMKNYTAKEFGRFIYGKTKDIVHR